jgi:hypothetical protein
VGPAAAQYGPPRGPAAHACFPADQTAAFLRVEWPQSGRWAVYNQPFGSNIRVFIGPEPAQWCFSVRLQEVLRPCRPAFTQPVVPGC